MKIREFRSNLKKHFDAAQAGQVIVIERNGVMYQLRMLVGDKPLKVKVTDPVCEHGKEKDMCMFYGCPFNPNKP